MRMPTAQIPKMSVAVRQHDSLTVSFNLFVIKNNEGSLLNSNYWSESHQATFLFSVTGFEKLMDFCALFIAQACINSFSLCTS